MTEPISHQQAGHPRQLGGPFSLRAGIRPCLAAFCVFTLAACGGDGFSGGGDGFTPVIVEGARDARAWDGYHSNDGSTEGNCRQDANPNCQYGTSGNADDLEIYIHSTQGSDTYGSFINVDTEATITGNVVLTGADNYFESTGGTYTGYVDMGAGDDTIVISGGTWAYEGGMAGTTPGTIYGGAGFDTLTISGSAVFSAITGEDTAGTASRDVIVINGGTVNGNVLLRNGDDELTFTGGTLASTAHVDGGLGDDDFTISAGTWAYEGGMAGSTPGTIYGGEGFDTLTISGSAAFSAITGEDTAGMASRDVIVINGGTVNGNVLLRNGDDELTFTGGTLASTAHVDGGLGDDDFTISAGTWAYEGGMAGSTPGTIYGGEGFDTLTISGSAVFSAITGEDTAGMASRDVIIINGGTVNGNVLLRNGDDEFTFTSGTFDTANAYVDGGLGDDKFTISAGDWEGYHSDIGGSRGECDNPSATAGCIYGGDGNASIVVTSGATFRSFINVNTTGRGNSNSVGGIVQLADGGGVFQSANGATFGVDLAGAATTSYVVGSGDADEFYLDSDPGSTTTWTGYHGGGGTNGTDCPATRSNNEGHLCIYGGDGSDTLGIASIRIGFITGEDADDVIDDIINITGAFAVVRGNIELHGGRDRLSLTDSSGLEITGHIDMGDHNDKLFLGARPDAPGATNAYITMGAGADETTFDSGTWVGYHSGDGESIMTGAGNKCGTHTTGCVYGGTDNAGMDTDGDEVVLTGGTFRSFVYKDTGTVTGNVSLRNGGSYFEMTDGTFNTSSDTGSVQGGGGADTFVISGGTLHGYLEGAAGNDTFEISSGTWAGYHGDGGDDVAGDDGYACTTSSADDCIYGDGGIDTLEISGTATISNGIRGEDTASDVQDTIMLLGGTIAGNILLGTGDDDITLSADDGGVDAEPALIGIPAPATLAGYGNYKTTVGDYDKHPLTGYINMEGGEDTIRLEGGCFYAYNGGVPSADELTYDRDDFEQDHPDGGHPNLTVSGVAAISYWGWFRCNGASDTNYQRRAKIFGGADTDTFIMSGGKLNRIVGDSGADDITITGGTIQRDQVTRDTVVVFGGNVETGGGDDSITLGSTEVTATVSDVTIDGDVDGGGDADDIFLYKATIGGDVLGDAGDDDIVLNGAEIDGPINGGTGADLIVLQSGTLDHVDGGDDNDIVRILGTVGDTDSTANIQFPDVSTGLNVTNCQEAAESGDPEAWICGGNGSDRLEYGSDAAIVDLTTTQMSSFEQSECRFLTTIHPDRIIERPAVVCSDISAPRISSFGELGRGFEQVAVSPELGLWGGLSSALQSFGRAMMEDFTSSFVIPSVVEESGWGRTAPLTRPFDFARFTRFAQGDSKGPFHARQTRLRGESTSHLTLTGVPGAVGTSSYKHDVNLIQQGFSQEAATGLVAEGGFHLMQGTLASSDGADQFALEGYGAGMKLAYGSADIAMLGAWFDLASDDWGRPMAFSGTQWIVSAGVERGVTIGGFSITPQARGFWQKTSIEEQGAIRFSDDLIFTGKAGLVIESGTHALDLFFTRDDDASSLDTGLVQNHRMEEALEAGWRSYRVADGFSFMGEVRYRHGLETGVDSYSAGVVLARAF